MKNPASATPDDPYWAVVEEQYDNIRYLYQQFADKYPVMLFDIQEQRVYAHPYGPFAADLSAKSQRSLARQYLAARKAGQLVVFIRDNEKRKLNSYSVPTE
jgi:hypothetical protein